MTPNERSNALAMALCVIATPVYVLLSWRETRDNWRNGR